jgi:iron complex outermembrane recepter protein
LCLTVILSHRQKLNKFNLFSALNNFCFLVLPNMGDFMMKFKLKAISAATVGAIGVATGATLLASQAMAQTPTPAPSAQKIEKIEVTGSNIKRVDSEGVSPIQVISRAEIERSGKQTVSELLRSLPSNAGGGLTDIFNPNSFSAGASTVSLRGLGSAATLVLLNGRRLAPFAPNDPNFGQSGVVNLDVLPVSVIDRIEILKDGSSAIYGSEAVAGVVNIILRKDYVGAEITGRFSINRDSEYKVYRAGTTLGVGDLARDRYNFFINYERIERERATIDNVQNYIVPQQLTASPTFQTLRRFTSSFAGNYLTGVYNTRTGQATAITFAGQQPANCDPGAQRISGICRWDVPSKQDYVAKSGRDNFFARGSTDLSATLSGFVELGFNRTETSFRGNPQVYGDFGPWYSSTLQRLVNMPEFLPVGNPNNPFTTPIILRHRFVEVGDRDQINKAEALRFLGGFKGTLGKFDWESAILYTKNENEALQKNNIRLSQLTAGVVNGTYNFLNPSAGSLKPSDLRINTRDTAKSSFLVYDAKGSTELAQLPAGPLGLAVGLEYRKEDRTASPDANKLTGEVVGFGAAISSGKRNVTSLFAELSVPVIKSVELQLAARTDRYSDYGNSTTPKIGFKWSALPSLAVRASFGDSFRAPSLTEISRSSVTAFTTVLDPRRCIDGTELSCNQNIAILLENADRLQPEKAKTYNIGAVWEPTKDLSFTLDYFDIRRRNEITTLDADLILANEGATSGRFANRIVRGPALPGESVGQLQAISTFFYNSGGTFIKGWDLEGRYNINLSEYGKLNNTMSLTYFSSFKGNSDVNEPILEFVSYGFPRARGNLRSEWLYRDFVTGITTNYNKGYKVLRDPTLTCSAAIRAVQPTCEVSSNTTYDFSLEWNGIKNLSLSFIARNIFDKQPPLDANARPLNATYHPFQSVYYTVGGTYRFK